MHNIIMSVGAAGAMNAAMYALMDVDDEVMVMRPYYPGYTSFILNWQGKKVEVDPVIAQTFYSRTLKILNRRLRNAQNW